MMKLILTTIVFFLFTVSVFSDVVKLKNGREFEGNIVEENDKHIKINIGIGTVGFAMDKVESIHRSNEDEQKDLNDKLEGKRKDALKQAKENERWIDKQEKRSALITKQKSKQAALKSRREEILQKRKNQLKKLRDKRKDALKNKPTDSHKSTMPVPPPPPLPDSPSPQVNPVNNTPPPPMPTAPEVDTSMGQRRNSPKGAR